MKFQRLVLLVSLFSLSAVYTATAHQSIFDLLSQTEVLEVKLAVDFQALTANKRDDTKHPATFSFLAADSTDQAWNIKVKLRGKFRRMRCDDTPPLKLYFDKKDLAAAGLADFNDLKLVNYCSDNLKEGRELLLREFLTYKMYNEISDASYRVQLLKITYQDTKSDLVKEQLAFIIEDTAQLRARLAAKKYKSKKEKERPGYDMAQVKMMTLFQYLIGNSDWQLSYEKNTKYFLKDDKLQVIPYDFDFAGIVDAPYARIKLKDGTSTAKPRIYQGTAEHLKDMDATIDLFRSKRKALLNLVKSNKLIKRKTRFKMIDYLNTSFRKIDVASLRAVMAKEGEGHRLTGAAVE